MMPNDSPIDGRVRRTLSLIKDAFIEQVIVDGFDKLTISALTRQAGINRATFYRHYRDKYDLAERLTELLFAEVGRPSESGERNPYLLVEEYFAHVAEYARFYKAMLGPGGVPDFRKTVQAEVEKRMMSMFDPDRATMPAAVPVRYLAAAQVGFIQWWLENDMPFGTMEAAGYLVTLHAHGGMAALGIEMPLPTADE